MFLEILLIMKKNIIGICSEIFKAQYYVSGKQGILRFKVFAANYKDLDQMWAPGRPICSLNAFKRPKSCIFLEI